MAFTIAIFINERMVDSVSVVNTGHKNSKGKYLYRIQIPEDLNHIEIYHDRDKPWEFLAKEIINKLIKIKNKKGGGNEGIYKKRELY